MAAQAHYVLNLPRGIHLHTQTLQLPMPTSSHEATFQRPAKPAGRSITISVYKVLIKTVGIEKKKQLQLLNDEEQRQRSMSPQASATSQHSSA